MSIIETKFRKGYVETPNLIADNANIGNIILEGHNLKDDLYTDYLFHEVYDSEDFVEATEEDTVSIGQESVNCFSFILDDVMKRKIDFTHPTPLVIRSITIKRANNDNAQLYGEEGRWANKYAEYGEVGLLAKVYDVDGNYIEPFVSEPNRQKNNEFETTYTFDNFEIKDNYHKVIVGFDNHNEGFITDGVIRIGSWKKNGQKVYKEGWDVSWYGISSGWQSNTPMISVETDQKAPAIFGHYNNPDLHLTKEEKEKLNQFNSLINIEESFDSHINDDTRHLTSSDTEAISKISTIEQTLNSHKTNGGTLHVTADEKTKWNNITNLSTKVTELEENIEGIINNNISGSIQEINNKVVELESSISENTKSVGRIDDVLNVESGNYYKYSFDTPISSDYVNDKENLATQMIRFGKSHFPTGRITEIELPYEYGKSNLTVYLAVQVVKKGESKDIAKSAEETVYSSNTQSQAYRAKGTSVFKFDNLIIPDDYQYVRLAFVSNTSTVPVYDGYNCTVYGVSVVDLVSDSDGCRLITDGFESRYGAQCRVKYAKSHVIQQLDSEINDVESNVTTVDSKINNHIGDASHLTDAQKTSISQISTISSDLNTHKTSGGTLHVTAEEKERWNNQISTLKGGNGIKVQGDTISINSRSVLTNESDIIPTAKIIHDELFRDTEENVIFDNYNPDVYGRSADSVRCIKLSRQHFITGKIDKVIFSHDNNPTNVDASGGYLVIQSFKGNELISTIASENLSAWNTTTSTYEWNFLNKELVGDYDYVRLFVVLDKDIHDVIAPTSTDDNIRRFRTYCLTKNDNKGEQFVYEESDGCTVYNGTWNANYIPCIKVSRFGDSITTLSKKVSEMGGMNGDVNSLLEIGHNEYVSYNYDASIPSKDDLPNHTTSQILIKREIFTTGKVEKIEVPYLKGTGLTGYMAVQIICTGEDSFRVTKTSAQTYYSTNAVTQTSGTEGVATFYFDNLLLPNDYYGVRISFVSDKTIVPQYEGTDCLGWGVKIVNSDGAHYNQLYMFRAGSSYLYSSYYYTMLLTVTSITSSLDAVGSLSASVHSMVKSHTDNSDIHVTADEKTNWNNKANPMSAGNYIDLTNDTINVKTATEITNDATTIPTTDLMFRELYSYSDFTQVKDNYVADESGNDKAHAFGTIVLTKNHFITGILRKVTFYHDNVTGNGVSTDQGYLCVEIYKNGSTEPQRIWSSTPSKFDSSKRYVFKFNDEVLPEDYTRVEMSMVTDRGVIPVIGSGTNTLKMRAYVLTSSDNSDGESNIYPGNDDECKLVWHNQTSTGNHVIRYTAEWATGEYDSRVAQLEMKVAMLQETVALLQAKIEELLGGS